VSSFIAALLSGKDAHGQLGAMQLAEALMGKLPSIFGQTFRREVLAGSERARCSEDAYGLPSVVGGV
jgi:hypothetical protein